MFNYFTAGESHGKALVVIINGIPAGVKVSVEEINRQLARRQQGIGRSTRMKLERDRAEVISGLRYGKTIGAPLAILIENKDWPNWQEIMAVEASSSISEPITAPRPGHADLAGLLKRGLSDVREVLERASARETAARTAAGAIARIFLREFGINVASHVIDIGGIRAKIPEISSIESLAKADHSPVRTLDKLAEKDMVERIRQAEVEGDTVGGIFEVLVFGCPPGLGDYTIWEKRLDGRIAQAVMSIPGIKGVEIGGGFSLASLDGSKAHDEIYFAKEKGFYRLTNRAGGIEGGMTNGEVILIRAVMKPIPTLRKPLKTVDFKTKQARLAFKERSDICVVPSAAVIGEAVVAIEITKSFIEKFGADSLGDIKKAYEDYIRRIYQ
jgi:chorismate synthase